MHGQGNDYILIDLIDYKSEITDGIDWNTLSRKLSDRHFGIGGDGIVLIEKSEVGSRKPEVQMRMFNADGSEAETCGTALRCVAFYLNNCHCEVSKQRSNQNIHTLSGIKECIIDETGMISVNMGKVVLEKEMTLEIDSQNIHGYCMNIGNPHFVVFDSDLLYSNRDIWSKIETHHTFINKTNVENIHIINDKEIRIKIWERGSGFTLACGSGACVSAFISHKVKNLTDKIKVYVPGGEVDVKILGDDNCVLSGSVEIVFETEIRLVQGNHQHL